MIPYDAVLLLQLEIEPVSRKIHSRQRRSLRKRSRSVRYFEADLRKLCKAYPGEDANESSVLLGRFVTGLLPEITRQMLLRGSPTTMEGAVNSAIEIERALGFQTVETQQVQALRGEETPVKGHGQKSEHLVLSSVSLGPSSRHRSVWRRSPGVFP